jgi:hypothetical protein
MALVSVLIDICDTSPQQKSYIPNAADGTKPVYKLVVGPGLAANASMSGVTALLTLSVTGQGGTYNDATFTGDTTVVGPIVFENVASATDGLGVAGGLNADVITVGPWSTTAGQQTTTGNSTVTLAQLPVGASRTAPLTFQVGADDGAHAYFVQSLGANYTTGGSPVLTQATPFGGSADATFPIPVSALVTYASGHIRINVTGPQATVSGCASNGDSPTAHVRVAVNETLASWAGTIPLDISGVVGTTEANGTNVAATYVDSHHFDLLAVAFVNAYVSGGLVLEHGNGRVVTWVGALGVLARTP